MKKNLYIPPEADLLFLEQENGFLEGSNTGQNLDSPYEYNPF